MSDVSTKDKVGELGNRTSGMHVHKKEFGD